MISIAKIIDPKCGVAIELQENKSVVSSCATKSYVMYASFISLITFIIMMLLIFTSKSAYDEYEKDKTEWTKKNSKQTIPSKPNYVTIVCISLAIIALTWSFLPLMRYIIVNRWKSKEYKQKLAKNAGLSDSQFYMQQESNVRNRKSNETTLKAANLTASAQRQSGYTIANAIRNK